MRTSSLLCSVAAAIVIAVLLAAGGARPSAQQSTDPAIRVGDKDLGGVVLEDLRLKRP